MGIDIYAILVNHQSAVAMKEKSGVDYDILYDENLAMARNMGLIHKDAIPVKDIDLAQPATFLFDANGKVIWSYISTNYRIRPETMDLLVAAERHFGS
jgi:peroxiredoxin